MDWISKFEREDRQKADAGDRTRERDLRNKTDEAARFNPVVARLRPLLEKEVTHVAQRLGIQLNLIITEQEVMVQAPRSHGSLLSSKFPFSFSLTQSDGHSVQVRAVDDERIDRNPDQWPDGMSVADYFGAEQTVVDVRASLDDLESGDLARLIEWLVVCYRSGGVAPKPQLTATERLQAELREQEARKRSRSASANWCLALSILSFILSPFLGQLEIPSLARGAVSLLILLPGPVALIWGVSIRRTLGNAGQKEGRARAIWAIVVGAYISLWFLFVLGKVLTYLSQALH